MIRRTELDRAVALVQRSGVHRDLEARLRPDGAGGRPRALRVDVFLAAVILAAGAKKNLALTNVHALLTTDIARSAQVHYGIRWTGPTGEGHCLTLRQVRYLLEAIESKLAHTAGRAPTLSDIDRTERADALQHILDELLAATMPTHLPPAQRFALDATALESWGRGKRRTSTDTNAETADPVLTCDPVTGEVTDADLSGLALDAGAAFDPDAHWGYRTRTYDNKTTMCFGYDVFAVTRMPDVGGKAMTGPMLTERLVVTAASTDVVAPALGILDRLSDCGRAVLEVAADRAWSYKLPDRWADELRARDIEAVLDLHPNDHGVRDFDGIRMVAGTPHCPAMPDRLIDIRRPAQLSVGPARPNMSAAKRAERDLRQAELDAFAAQIAMRETWAFRRVTGPDATGKERWECPAQAGKRVCYNCPLSQLFPAGTPEVESPPELATAPQCCTQRTVTIPGHVTAKIRQRLYWGSPAWIASFSRRTYIEGIFGNWKSPKTENVRRGWTFVTGIVKTSLMVACVTVAANLRLLRKWATRVGDHTDPLTTLDPEHPGFEELTQDTGATGILGPPTED
ncbi:MAG: hypothetical protein QOE76_2239 [Frankiales bacterium]|nr:hypothetical protein [Frankiales bacterium]